MKLLLLIFALLASVDASAKLLAGKSFISKFPAARQENVFEYQIINIGQSPAINVHLDDRNSFPTDKFEVRKGSPHTKFASIPPNTTVYHHVVVVPLEPQEINDKDVIIDYTDSESGETHRSYVISYDKMGNNYYFSEKSLRRVNGLSVFPFIGFAGIVLPLTAASAFFYWNSMRRFPTKKRY